MIRSILSLIKTSLSFGRPLIWIVWAMWALGAVAAVWVWAVFIGFALLVYATVLSLRDED